MWKRLWSFYTYRIWAIITLPWILAPLKYKIWILGLEIEDFAYFTTFLLLRENAVQPQKNGLKMNKTTVYGNVKNQSRGSRLLC